MMTLGLALILLSNPLTWGGPITWCEDTSNAAASDFDDAPLCDNGDPIVWESGSLNERCIIDDCWIGAQSCWNYRLDHCFDEEGIFIEGSCVLEDYKCYGTIDCAWDLAFCDGAFECIEKNEVGVGCAEGICIEEAGG